MRYMFFVLTILLLPVAHAADTPATDYIFVPAGTTNLKLGPNGDAGDIISRVIIVPETTGAGTISIRDGASNAAAYKTNIFVAGTLSDLSPIVIDLNARSVSDDWNITTGSNVHAIVVGKFR